jgi:hypothetical protein
MPRRQQRYLNEGDVISEIKDQRRECARQQVYHYAFCFDNKGCPPSDYT